MLKARTTIGRLLALIGLAAVGLAAFGQASELAVGLTSYLALAILIYASLQARYSSGSRADWWFGFALLGGIHLLIGRGGEAPKLCLDDFIGWVLRDPSLRYAHGDQICTVMIAHNLFSLVVGWLGGWGVAWYAARLRRRSASTEIAPGGG